MPRQHAASAHPGDETIGLPFFGGACDV